MRSWSSHLARRGTALASRPPSPDFVGFDSRRHPPYRRGAGGHATGGGDVMDLFQTCYDYVEPVFARMAGIYPFFLPLEGSEGPVVTYQGKDVVMMGSNNYLGLTHHPK